MYLHLGRDTLIRMDDVIGIFDLDNASVAKRTRDYLAGAEKRGEVVNVSMELPRSFIVCRVPEGGQRIYISQISSQTLCRRTGFLREISLDSREKTDRDSLRDME